MSVSTQPYKGARDFYPEDKRLQKYTFSIMRKVAESFGYVEYDAPILEPTDLFLMKGSDEIVNNQTYTFSDRGGRSVTMRTEMTPSISRMVAGRRQELSYPLRWYSIPNLWRYERPQRGRLREFWQLNIDIFGVAGVEADHEVILVADSLMKAYGAKPSTYKIKVNSRAFVRHILRDHLKLEQVQAEALIRLIDRMHKVPIVEFFSQVDILLSPSQRDAGIGQKLAHILALKNPSDLPAELQSHPSLDQLNKLFELLGSSQVTSAEFDITLARGFDYYTDIVFEVFDKHPDNNRAMFGGGRYDGMVGLFGVEPVPTVGFGMGDVSLLNFLETHDLLPKLPSEIDAAVLLIGDIYKDVQTLLHELRKEGLHLAVDSTGRTLDKQLRGAAKNGLKYALIIGNDELKSSEFKLKNLQTGHEENHGLERTVSILAAQHQTDVLDL